MFSIQTQPIRLCDSLSRRELLRVGGLSALGLSLPALLQAREISTLGIPSTDKTFGRARNLIFLYLQGGPPQHETFDPKPDAPLEIRGPFKPISTNIPGIQFCELLPRTAQMADKLAVVRSMSTDDNNHDSSGYWVITGYKYVGPNSRTIQPTDWPYFGSIVKMLKPSELLPSLSTVWIPDIMRLNESVTPAGQTAGFLGGQWHPDRFIGDPSDPRYRVQGLEQSQLPAMRLKDRESLLKQVERHFRNVERGQTLQVYDKYQQQAFDLMTSTRARDAFAIQNEPEKLKDRYGRTQWGQSVLLARRLIEAGVRMVHVNWPREPGDNAVDNPLWDTHAQNADRVEDVLCPQFDVSFTALLEDLETRGLLDETLVIAIGEFGRTPSINANGGRDHWGPVFSFAMAGAGISGGQVYGASDAKGAYPARDRVQPGDLTATIFHLLGINPQQMFHDREGREHRLTLGAPLDKLLGTEPATRERTQPTADVSRVPPYDNSLVLNTDFSAPVPLRPFDNDSRPKGWRATPLLASSADDAFGVKVIEDQASSAGGKRHVAIGFGLGAGTAAHGIKKGARAILAQEVRSPFAGRYVLSACIAGRAGSKSDFEELFLKNFTCRLVYFQYLTSTKNPASHKELASLTFQPKFVEGSTNNTETIEFPQLFENPNPGANFSFGRGMGVGVFVEQTGQGELFFSSDRESRQAWIQIDEVQLKFFGKARKDDVTV